MAQAATAATGNHQLHHRIIKATRQVLATKRGGTKAARALQARIDEIVAFLADLGECDVAVCGTADLPTCPHCELHVAGSMADHIGYCPVALRAAAAAR